MRGIWLAAAALATACSFDPSGSDGLGADSDGGGDADSATRDDSGTGDAGPAALTNRGLFLRYFIDEAASGQPAINLQDRGPEPMELLVQYNGGTMTFTEEGGNRGLTWSAAADPGMAQIRSNEGPKLLDFAGQTQITVEVVFRIAAVTSSPGSFISHVGTGAGLHMLTLIADRTDRLQFFWGTGSIMVGEWNVDVTSRHVAHVVIDTPAAADQRIKLYIDGSEVANSASSVIPQSEALTITLDKHYCLGNRSSSSKSFQGTLFYGALYQAALSPGEVASNAARLLADDDF